MSKFNTGDGIGFNAQLAAGQVSASIARDLLVARGGVDPSSPIIINPSTSVLPGGILTTFQLGVKESLSPVITLGDAPDRGTAKPTITTATDTRPILTGGKQPVDIGINANNIVPPTGSSYVDNLSSVTDEEISKLLKDKGYNVARRTVAKYREQLEIPISRMRKEL